MSARRRAGLAKFVLRMRTNNYLPSSNQNSDIAMRFSERVQ